MGFEIRVHEVPTIIEVVYPASPTLDDVQAYAEDMRARIAATEGEWSCLVDQSQLRLMRPEVFEVIADLNLYARERGMARAARAVASSVAELQTSRLRRSASLMIPVETFTWREEAMAWLRQR